MNDLKRMKKLYTETQKDIESIDKNINNEIQKHYSGTGTLFENDCYMLGRTTQTEKNLKKLLIFLKVRYIKEIY